MKITVINSSTRSFYLEGTLVPAKGTAEVDQRAFAKWVSDNRDSAMLRFLRWGGGMEALFPEGHEMREYDSGKPRIGGHERGMH